MGIYPESFLAPMRQDIELLDARISRAEPVSDARLTLGTVAPGAGEAADLVESDAARGGAH
jgi:NADH-quinone oxidoreductase subunit M